MKDFDLAETYIYKLHVLTKSIDTLFENTLHANSELGLTQFMTLLIVNQYQPVNQRKVALHLLQSPAAISRQVELAWKKGWINVGGASNDKRGQVITMTPNGAEQLQKGLKALNQHAFDVFSDEHMQTDLLGHMDLLLRNLGNRGDKII